MLNLIPSCNHVDNSNKQQAERNQERKHILDVAKKQAMQEMERALKGEQGKMVGWNTL